MVVTVPRGSGEPRHRLADAGAEERDHARQDQRNMDVPFGFQPFPSPPQGGNMQFAGKNPLVFL